MTLGPTPTQGNIPLEHEEEENDDDDDYDYYDDNYEET